MSMRLTRRRPQPALQQAARSAVESLESRLLLAGNVETVDVVFQQADGKVILAGRHDNTGDIDLVRFNADSTLDTTFGTGGIATVDFGGTDIALDLAQDASGNLYVAGNTDASLLSVDFAVAKVSSAGVQDLSFGAGGAALADFGGFDSVSKILVQSSGPTVSRIVLVGSANSTTTFYNEFGIAQFDATGSLDGSFDTDGLQTLGTPDGDAAATSAILAGNDLIVGGYSTDGGFQTNFTLARYDAAGQLDSAFGDLASGVRTTTLAGPSQIFALADDGAGNVLAIGRIDDGGTQLGVFTYAQSDGALTDTFTDTTIYTQLDVLSAGVAGTTLVVSGQAGTLAGAASYDLNNLAAGATWVSSAEFGDATIDRNWVDSFVASDGSVLLAANVSPLEAVEFDYEAQALTSAGAQGLIYSHGFGAAPTGPSAEVIDGVLTILGSGSANNIQVHRNAAGDYVVTIDALAAQVFSAASVTSISIDGGDGADTLLVGAGITLDAVIHGGAGNDTITAGGGNDQIHGDADNDVLLGRAGRDSFYGGAGDDSITGGSGNDILLGEGGQDSLFGSSGADAFVGGDGNDLLSGGNGRDVLIGGSGADTITGDNGDDLLISGYTYYDTDLAGLQSILGLWIGGGTYEQRVAAIQTELLTASKVSADGDIDILSGNNGKDYFVADSADVITDLVKKEVSSII